MDRNPLDNLIEEEMLSALLRLLSREEALVATMRYSGYTDGEIAERLGVERSTVAKWMIKARRRIAREMPEAAVWLGARSRKLVRRRKRE